MDRAMRLSWSYPYRAEGCGIVVADFRERFTLEVAGTSSRPRREVAGGCQLRGEAVGDAVRLHANGALGITVGARGTKGVMLCEGSSSSSVGGHNAREPSRAIGLLIRARLGVEGGERWWFASVGRGTHEAREKRNE